MRKKALEKRLARLQSKKSKLVARATASQDVNEVRAINEELEDLNAEIEETQEEIEAIETEERTAQQSAVEVRSDIPVNAHLVNGAITGSFTTGATNDQKRSNEEI